jgi:S-formylglutathione hydrolase FrmB
VSALLHISLIKGFAPAAVTIGAFAALAVSVFRRGWQWWARVAACGAVALLTVVTLAKLIGVTAEVQNGFPQSFFVWAALPVFALGVAVCGWRSCPTWQRAVSITAVVLLTAFSADTINAFYAYRPTLGDAIGATMPDTRSARATLVSSERPKLPDHGTLVTVDIPSSTRFRARPALVWLPPAYTTSVTVEWPVVMMLAGVPGDPSDMVRAGGAAQIADAYATAHHGVAPILVLPDHNGGFFHDTECVDGPRGDAETYLTRDVRNYMQQHYGASTNGRQWAIVGYSEGGTCALTLALRQPDLFGAFVDIGGDREPNATGGAFARVRTVRALYGGVASQWQAHDAMRLLRQDASPASLLAVFADGTRDRRHYRDGLIVSAAARRAGFPTRFESVPGGHNFRMVHRALTSLLPSIADYVLR